ncbi:hypothetical protein B0H16DRAFT_1456733 [Mycena metata]|uniref:Uncharacterized protein n=1 Tax=Mycena metata TaxID=1033252 RepID=A0AAD7JD95_9AGAR|nr:hypothetical protein B0H16DRAFT_1456733 [Mycena metata]
MFMNLSCALSILLSPNAFGFLVRRDLYHQPSHKSTRLFPAPAIVDLSLPRASRNGIQELLTMLVHRERKWYIVTEGSGAPRTTSAYLPTWTQRKCIPKPYESMTVYTLIYHRHPVLQDKPRGGEHNRTTAKGMELGNDIGFSRKKLGYDLAAFLENPGFHLRISEFTYSGGCIPERRKWAEILRFDRF